MKFLIIIIAIIQIINIKILHAQDLESDFGDEYRFKSFQTKDYDFNNYEFQNESNQNNYNSQAINLNQNNYNSYDSLIKNYQLPIQENKYNYKDIYNENELALPNNLNSLKKNQLKNYKNFSDQKGIGYRVYDNSNRQSYFCGLNNQNKPNFTHDNNFNGLYFGIGANFIKSDISFDEIVEKNKVKTTFSNSASSNSVNPSVIMGQGRLFSNGLFLGQEMSIILGDINVKKDLETKTKDGETSQLKKMNFYTSNYSFYSGKFGVNVFKNYLPYVKLGISFGNLSYMVKHTNKNDIGNGNFMQLLFGFGLDISIFEHYRIILDHTVFGDSVESDGIEILNSMNKKTHVDAKSMLNISRINLVWRF